MPEVDKIILAGSRVIISVAKVHRLADKLTTNNSNHLPTLSIYAAFLCRIANDPDSGRVAEKVEAAQKTLLTSLHFVSANKYSDTCLLTLSGNINSLGIIQKANNQTNK